MQTKITGHQLFSLASNLSLGPTVIVIAAFVASVAQQDAWISALISPIFGASVILIYCFLGSQYSGLTYIGIIRRIFGKWIGYVVSGGFVFLCIEIATNVLWHMQDFVMVAMPETPGFIINLLFVVSVIIALLYGIEAFARASEILMYFSSGLLVLALLLLLPDIKIQYLSPVLEKGISPVLKSSFFFIGFSTFPLIILMMIYPKNVNNILNSKKSFLKGYLWASLLIFLINLISILVLGSALTAHLMYPTYSLAKEITLGNVFSRIDFVISAAWIFTLFICEVLFIYAGTAGLSEPLGINDHKKIVIPLGLIIFIMSDVVFPSNVYYSNWITVAFTPYMYTFGFILPVMLFLVFFIKKLVFKRV